MRRLLTTAALILLLATPAYAADLSGYVALETRTFPDDAQFEGQSGDTLSLSFEPEYYHAWDDGSQQLTVRAFARLDSVDEARTHFDLRELFWLKTEGSWELSVGFRQIFWGVTESQHLVDIVNQSDLVEDPDGEKKLGQPMLSGRLIRDWGTLDLFILTGFRERTFPGEDGRLRPGPIVDTDNAQYESLDGSSHVDWAVRWSNYLGPIDMGVSHFSGTSRDPRLLPARDEAEGLLLIPYYDQIDQTGLDLQVTTGAALWKLEAIRRRDSLETYAAATGGLEYTFNDVRSSGIDVGIIAEYLWDERGTRASTPFQDDLFVGFRIALNDVSDTQILAGSIVDTESGAAFFNLEASRRIASDWNIEIRARAFSGMPEDDILSSFRRDSYLQIELARYFD